MRYHVPRLEPPPRRAEQRAVVEKLGGLPWGVEPSRWPVCSECGRHQTHLATLLHHPDRLDLGRPGRVLMVFQCEWEPGVCDTWSPAGGGSTAVVVDSAWFANAAQPVPAEGIPVSTEAWITGWTAADDAIDQSTYGAFFADDTRNLLDAGLVDGVPEGTKLGGTPHWVQSAEDGPGDGWTFALQLDSQLRFAADPGRAVKTRRRGAHWIADGPSFGDLGMAYVFLGSSDPTRTVLFWQCG